MFASLHVHRFGVRQVPSVLPRFQRDAKRLGSEPGLRAMRVLTHGGGDHVGMAPGPNRLSVFAVWEDEAALEAALAREHPALHIPHARTSWQVRLRPLRSSGTWTGDELFPGLAAGRTPAGPVVVLIFIRVKATHIPRFWLRSLPGPSRQLMTAPGMLQALWMVEAPFRTGVTFTVWDGLSSMSAFGHRDGAHAEVMRRDGERDFAEFFIARFTPTATSGDLDGRDPLAGLLIPPS